MNFFSLSIRKQFIQNQLKQTITFPDEFDQSYSQTRKQLKRILKISQESNIDTSPRDLNNIEGPLDTAREFTYLLPTHTAKAYREYLRNEEVAQKKKNILILDKPVIHLLDIGCGGGAASVALLMIISNYQKHRIALGLPTYPVKLNILGIDPNPHALVVYNQFLNEIGKVLNPLLISVDFKIINGKLSESNPSILQWLNSFETINSCLFVFSNVIRPLSDEYKSIQSQQPKIYPKRRLINSVIGIGNPEIWSLNSILTNLLIDNISIILISSPTKGAKNKEEGSSNWLAQTRQFQYQITTQLRDHKCVHRGYLKKQSVQFLGPTDCYFRRVRKDEIASQTDYFASFLMFESKQFDLDKKEWLQILDINNLLLAWAKVRNEMAEATLEDTLEIRLFEVNILDRLEQLRCHILSYDLNYLGVESVFNFLVPKGKDKTPRPMSICRLEEQIIATAIVQFKSDEFSKLSKKSYAYRLSTKKDRENLYEDWYVSHKKFIKDARDKATDGSQIIQTDLSSYYTMIDQKKLLDEFLHTSRLTNIRFRNTFKRLVLRNCGLNSPNFGIPQGHIISGMLANIYLAPIDNLFGDGNQWGLSYLRYVDDMIFIIPKHVPVSEILDRLDSELESLGLLRSKDKTSEVMDVEKFLRITETDHLLDDLSKKFNYLVASLYKLNLQNYKLLSQNWWKYVADYQKLLCSIDYFVSVPRLSRKINQNLGWWDKLKMYFFPPCLLPRVESFEELESTEEWVNAFTIINSTWIKERREIHEQIKSLFNESLNILNDPDKDEEIRAKAKKKFKFSINRLGRLGFEELTEVVTDIIIDRPWLVHVRRVCEDLALQGKEDALLRIARETTAGEERGFVKACAIKAFEMLANPNSDFLSTYVFSNSITQVENLLASEAICLAHESVKRLSKGQMVQGNFHEAVKRNLILASPSDEVRIINPSFERQVNEAIQFRSILKNEPELLSFYEPDILRKQFYQSSYPDDDSEFPDFPSWI